MKRPTKLSEYCGQPEVKSLLALELKSGFPRSILVYGSPGLGKTSLGFALSNEIKGCEFKEYVAQPDWDAEDIFNLLMALPVDGYDRGGRPGPSAEKYLVFIDEAHNLSGKASDALLRPIEDGHVFSPKSGQASWLAETCYMFATTNPEKLSLPLRDRLALQFHLRPYDTVDLTEIIRRNFPKMEPALTEDIARRSKGTPRLALSYADSIDRYKVGADEFFALRKIDKQGLDERDRAYMKLLQDADRPLSLSSLSSALKESSAIVTMMEANLIYLGLVEVTSRGRIAVQKQARGTRQE